MEYTSAASQMPSPWPATRGGNRAKNCAYDSSVSSATAKDQARVRQGSRDSCLSVCNIKRCYSQTVELTTSSSFFLPAPVHDQDRGIGDGIEIEEFEQTQRYKDASSPAAFHIEMGDLPLTAVLGGFRVWATTLMLMMWVSGRTEVVIEKKDTIVDWFA